MTRSEEDPFRAHDSTPLWRRVLEGVLLDLPQLPAWVDRDPIATRVEDALAHAVTFEDETELDAERLDSLVGLATKLDEVCSLVARAARQAHAAQRIGRRLESVARDVLSTRSAILEILQRTRPRVTQRAPRSPAFAASHGVPRRHELRRAFLPPYHDPDPDPFADEDDDEALAWRAFPSPASAEPDEPPAARPGLSARPDVRRLARDCLEDIGLLGQLRNVGPDDLRHLDVRDTEARLLAAYDALLALGDPYLARPSPRRRGLFTTSIDVLYEAQRFAAEAIAGDPVRAFASTFVLASVHGDDALYAAVFALRRAHPYTLDAHRDALQLAPSPAVGRAIRPLTQEADPALCALALDVMRLRREADFGIAAPLLDHPKPQVRAAAASCLGAVPERPAALDALERALGLEKDAGAVVAICEALLRLRSVRAVEHTRELLARERDPASETAGALVRLLALAGEAADVPLVARLAESSPERVEWLGFLGAPAALEAAAEIYVRSPHLRMGQAARFVFERILGPQALGDVVREPHDVPDPQTLSAIVRGTARSLGPTTKYRWGAPYRATDSLDELAKDAVRGRHRDACALEVSMATGGASLLEPSDWDANQAGCAASLAAPIEREAKDRSGRFFVHDFARPLSGRT